MPLIPVSDTVNRVVMLGSDVTTPAYVFNRIALAKSETMSGDSCILKRRYFDPLQAGEGIVTSISDCAVAFAIKFLKRSNASCCITAVSVATFVATKSCCISRLKNVGDGKSRHSSSGEKEGSR